MSRRLQVIFDDQELEAVQAAARRRGVPVSTWVRRALREAREQEPQRDLAGKLEAVRKATRHALPTGDVDDMLSEIERSYVAAPGGRSAR
jgi:Ribbon-helix-helix protein, copG family